MSRRITRVSVLVAVTALAVSSFASGAGRTSDRGRKQEKTQQETTAQAHPQPDPATKAAESPAPAPATLEETFAAADAKSIETEDGVSAAVGPIEVVVARIGPDGKPVMACVDDLEAARRFLQDSPEQQAPKQDKEQ